MITVLLITLSIFFEFSGVVNDSSLSSLGEAKNELVNNEVAYLPWRSHESDLRDLLMRGYDKAARPSVSVNVSFFPTLKHFDMVS